MFQSGAPSDKRNVTFVFKQTGNCEPEVYPKKTCPTKAVTQNNFYGWIGGSNKDKGSSR